LGPLTRHQRPADEKRILPVYSRKSNSISAQENKNNIRRIRRRIRIK